MFITKSSGMNLQPAFINFAWGFRASPVIKAFIRAKTTIPRRALFSCKFKYFITVSAGILMIGWGYVFGVFFFNMLSSGYTQLQIFWPIVIFFSVNMMYNFFGKQMATNTFLHYQSVFTDSTPFIGERVGMVYNKYIPTIISSTPFPIGMILTTNDKMRLPLVPRFLSESIFITKHYFSSIIHTVIMPYTKFIARDDGTFSLVLQHSIGKLPSKE